ncbi:ABC transporter permease [Anaerobranca gottschalkii]|uniref:ABC-2 family transporter protein n=1 Tax=Anaerobranca gottschalkii DSM 13577 TaxID=1120990 RepID=A0A1H9YPB5_9FIRM|nr:ABC transporter permease [Anaerobranca gottschalkii]SES70975.1 ABC-2 family transporter protein [Anaerobranca gottschalkii DSM 13577]
MKVLHLALNHLKLLFKYKMTFVWFFALPITLTLIIGSSMGENPSEEVFPVAILDEENSFFTNYIIERIEEDDKFTVERVDFNSGLELVEKSEVAGFIHFPKNLSKVYFYPSRRRISPLMLEKNLEKSIVELNNSLRIAQGIAEVFSPDSDILLLQKEILPKLKEVPISAQLSWTNGSEIPVGNNMSSPGMAILFTLMSVVFSGAGVILSDKHYKTFDRLLTTPTSRRTIILGKSLGIFLVGFVQLSILILFGQFVLKVNWGGDILATILLSLAFVFAASGLAMALVSICNNNSQLNVLGNIIVIGISMLGGCYWPIELLPNHMQIISKLVPTGWAMQGYTDIILRGLGLNDVLLNIFVLLIFGFILNGFGIYKLKNIV